MFNFLFEVNPAFNHAAGLFLMLGGSLTFVLVVLFTMDREDKHHSKPHKTKKAK